MREGWEYKKLGEVCDFKGGSQPPKDEWSKEKKEGYIRMLQIRDFTQSATDYIEYVKISNSLKLCSKDDILIGRYGASVGKILTGLEGAYNVAIIKSIPNEKILEKNYIRYYFYSEYFQSNLIHVSQQRAAQQGFSRDDIVDFKIPIPPKSTQLAIVSELDKISELIRLKKEQLVEYDNLAQSIFYEMFGDPVENEKGWEVKKLGEISREIGDGLHGTPEYTENNTGCYFINGNNLENGVIVIKENTKQVSEETKAKHYIEMDNYTILISINGSLGKTAFYNGENVILGKSACYIKLNYDINKRYVYEILKSDYFKKYANEEYTGTTIKNISLKSMRNFPLLYPPLPLQQSFASRIEQIEKLKSEVQNAITDLETLLASRMQYWFE